MQFDDFLKVSSRAGHMVRPALFALPWRHNGTGMGVHLHSHPCVLILLEAVPPFAIPLHRLDDLCLNQFGEQLRYTLILQFEKLDHRAAAKHLITAKAFK